jgi:large subunit ribosomal protein L18
MSAQIVDDFSQRTIVHVSSDSKEFAEKSAAGAEKKPLSKTDRSKIVGQMVAEKAKGKGVTKVVFDRKGFAYHGRVKALADAARSGGLQF